MNKHELIDLVLRPRTISLAVSGPLHQQADLTVELPELRDAPRSVWGDWGPMYTVFIPPGRRIELEIRGGADSETKRETLAVETLAVESPMMADVRQETPLVMDLPLQERNLRIEVFYDAWGRAAKAEVAPLSEPGQLVSVRVNAPHAARSQPA